MAPEDKRQVHAFVLNEFSLLPFVFSAFSDRDVTVISVRPVLPPLRKALRRIVESAIARGKARYAIDDCPELDMAWRWDRYLYFNDTFERLERWSDIYFRHIRILADRDTYGYAVNCVTANYVYDLAIEIYLAESLERNINKGRSIKFFLPYDTAAAFRSYFSRPLPNKVRRNVALGLLFNFSLAAMFFLATIFWVCKKIRPNNKPEPVFAIVDRLGNAQEEYLIDEMREGGTVISLKRSPTLQIPDAGRFVTGGDGAFRIGEALATCAMVFRDTSVLFKRHGNLFPGHFYAIAGLVRRRTLWRGLFNISQPIHFFGRDEYSSDHILRRKELNKFGGTSHGITAGVHSAYTSLAPNVRYVSFDHYYVIGRGIIGEYLNRWPQDMSVESVGTWGFSRADIGQPNEDPRVILISIRIAFASEEMKRIVHKLASTFPAKKIFLQLKPTIFLGNEQREELVQQYSGGFSNVIYKTEPIYDLVARARYHVTDISTIAAESIHVGKYVFVADILEQQNCVYRRLPGLCFSKAEEVVDRISRIENGTDTYPTARYRSILGITDGAFAFDYFRKNTGLPALPSVVPALERGYSSSVKKRADPTAL